MSKSKTTFLDLPLERDLYECRPLFDEKPPLRVLITDAGQKFVYCLIYKICTGEIFGKDQEVYIHLVNSKGVIDHKTIFYELDECGFHLLKGWVVTSNVEEAYSKVHVVVLSTTFEERSGLSHKETLASQIIKGRQTMRNIATFCSPKVQIVLVGPSTKFSLALLEILHNLEPEIPAKNLSVVTLLDEAIARANLAARLRTTTNKIKNIVVWGVTCPDVHNATVRMYPKNDLGALEEVEVSVHEALGDDKYLHDEFVESVYKRKIGPEFTRSGKSLAIATARHLKALYQGSKNDEIISMGVLTPPSEPYGVPQGFPFSFPVNVPGNGTWSIREVRTVQRTCQRLNTPTKKDTTFDSSRQTLALRAPVPKTTYKTFEKHNFLTKLNPQSIGSKTISKHTFSPNSHNNTHMGSAINASEHDLNLLALLPRRTSQYYDNHRGFITRCSAVTRSIAFQDVKYDVCTHLNLIRSISRILNKKEMFSLERALQYIHEYEDQTNDIVKVNQRKEIAERIEIPSWNVKYFIESLPDEAIPKSWPSLKVQKSIGWYDGLLECKEEFRRKSSIRFGGNDTKKLNSTVSILKRTVTDDVDLSRIRRADA